MIRTPDEAYAAGLAALCDHRRRPPECEHCRLTETEIARIAVLLSPVAPQSATRTAA